MNLSKIRERVNQASAEFIRDKIAPMAGDWDKEKAIPLEILCEMGKLGLLGLPYPYKFGGSDLGYISYIKFVRDVAIECASLAMTIVTHCGLCCYPVFSAGTPEQQRCYLPDLISGQKIGAFGLTEPQAGSDVSALETVALEDEDCYRLTGNKVFITNGNIADVYIIAAKTLPLKGVMGISLFIVEKGAEGFSTSDRNEGKLGMRASDTGTLYLNNVKVPKKSLLGRKNRGFGIIHKTLQRARLGMAAIGLGISIAAQNCCVEYAGKRKQFGKYIYQFQSIKNKIADMGTHINALEMLLQNAVRLKDGCFDFSKEASMAKLFASETAMKTTREAIQIMGAYGCSEDYPLERFFRNAKITEIGDGTSEIQRSIIADKIIKKPNKNPFLKWE